MRERASVRMEQLVPRLGGPLGPAQAQALATALGASSLDAEWAPRRASTGLCES